MLKINRKARKLHKSRSLKQKLKFYKVDKRKLIHLNKKWDLNLSNFEKIR